MQDSHSRKPLPSDACCRAPRPTAPCTDGAAAPAPCTGHTQPCRTHRRLPGAVCRAVRESEKSECEISMFRGTAGTDCPYVTHTHHQSSGKCTHLRGFHFSIFPCWTCQRNFAASPYTFAKKRTAQSFTDGLPSCLGFDQGKKAAGGDYYLEMCLWKHLCMQPRSGAS